VTFVHIFQQEPIPLIRNGSNWLKSTSSTYKNSSYKAINTVFCPGKDIASNLYRFQVTEDQDLEKYGSEFFAVEDAQGQECWMYKGRTSKIRYWTWSLDPKSGYVDIGKGEGKESGRRKHLSDCYYYVPLGHLATCHHYLRILLTTTI
jgi:glucose dehydrogenase